MALSSGQPMKGLSVSRLIRSVAIAACAMAAVPAVAGAKPGDRSFEKTYPHASKLCAAVAAGKTPTKLSGAVPAITTACSTLTASFTAAGTTFDTAVAPLKTARADAVASAKAACVKGSDGTRDKAACKAAIQTSRTTIKGLREQGKTAVAAYRTSVRTARKAFWTTIKGLRGGSTVTPDTRAVA